MNIVIPQFALEGKPLPPLPSRLSSFYWWLWKFYQDKGLVYASTAYMAEKQNVTPRLIADWLAKLERLGYIRRVRVGNERHVTPLALPVFWRSRRVSAVEPKCSRNVSAHLIEETQNPLTHDAPQQTPSPTPLAAPAPGEKAAAVVVAVEEVKEKEAERTNEMSADVMRCNDATSAEPAVVARLRDMDAPAEVIAEANAQPEEAARALGVVEAMGDKAKNRIGLFRAALRRGWAKTPTTAQNASAGHTDAFTGEEWDRARARHLGHVPESEFGQLEARARRHIRETLKLGYYSQDLLAQKMAQAWRYQVEGKVRT